jgi:hypothetical protein
MAFYSENKPDKCPECGSERIGTFLYGEPSYSKQLMDEIQAGKVILVGCCIADYDPTWRCIDCKTEIFQKNPSKNWGKFL